MVYFELAAGHVAEILFVRISSPKSVLLTILLIFKKHPVIIQ